MKHLNHHFQTTVDKFLVRNQSILDTTSKFQEACGRTNRAIVKAVTGCGCIRINAEKQKIPKNFKLNEVRILMRSHIEGKICDKCKEIIEDEMGEALVYIAAICNLLNLDLHTIIKQEQEKLQTLGVFSLV